MYKIFLMNIKINTKTNTTKIKENLEVIKTVLGLLLIVFSILLSLSFVSFYINWESDQSEIDLLFDSQTKTNNLLGNLGAFLGEFCIHRGIGVSAFLIPITFFLFGIKLLLDRIIIKTWKYISHSLFILIWVPIFFGYFNKKNFTFSGIYGFETSEYLKRFIGEIGIIFFIIVTFFIYIILEFKISAKNFREKIYQIFLIFKNIKNQFKTYLKSNIENELNLQQKVKKKENNQKKKYKQFVENKTSEYKNNTSSILELNNITTKYKISNQKNNLLCNYNDENIIQQEKKNQEFKKNSIPVSLKTTTEKDSVVNIVKINSSLLAHYEPRLELPNYRFPHLDLMRHYDLHESITINNEELKINKNKIVKTLDNYGIGISHIKATVGPTVTLYEVIPNVGIRISKIKNLENDIALSLSALGIRIIAPIPGKGTIGIEVPNSNPSIVSIRSVLSSQKFQKSDMELPLMLGKTISNETFVEDLVKMPHLLLAGATGQGKSVGLNAMIISLLYQKHPAELKFVLIDPKKVELTLYNKIERHFLAKLPDSEEAIITDNQKVINTLNSLCIEMDYRYNLLKNAMVRNIKEYNKKFIKRELDLDKGHRFLPYIVLIIDEFADLIMTVGKDIESPITRLTQLARAIGIHLIIGTQRPSVNVITGTIKANFPARIAFRVTSKIDSRTILDASGADQLIGRGDMLFTKGNETVRLQCACVDTQEVEKITDFICSQSAFPNAYLLPELNSEKREIIDNRGNIDELLKAAARVIVSNQHGSTALIQRKLSLGYNRAGRIMDQLERLGIVGSFERSKARKVLFVDIPSLEQFLSRL